MLSKDYCLILQLMLFEINVNPYFNTKPFCNIQHLSAFEVEEEVLFSIGSLFRITSIEELNSNLWKACLISTTEEDEELKQLRNYFKFELGDTYDICTLGLLLFKMGKSNDGTIYFQKPFKQTKINIDQELLTDDDHRSYFLSNDESNKTLIYYQNILENQWEWILSNNSIQSNSNRYDRILEIHEKKLQIQLKSLISNYLSLSITYYTLGIFYYEKQDYD
ncbi:unnamed protein product, partial [Rotaria sp. Silwood2]